MSQDDLEKIERDLLKKWAKRFQSDARKSRPVVRMPQFPHGMFAQPNLSKSGLEEWQTAFKQRQVQAIMRLADENEADPVELMKVAGLLLDIRPPETRGQQPIPDLFAVFIRAAVQVEAGKPQKTAAELAGVSDRTLRDYINEYPREWEMMRDFAQVYRTEHRKDADPLEWIDPLGYRHGNKQ